MNDWYAKGCGVKIMVRCTIYHTGVYMSAEGVIKDHKVYLKGKEGKLYFPKEMFMAIEECEGGLIQFAVKGKWGFADIYTGKIVIKPIWDYAGPFYDGYAHVALGAQVEDDGYDVRVQEGKHGYIDIDGTIIIELEYDYANEIPYRHHFIVAKREKWGMITKLNQTVIPFIWDRLLTSYQHNLIFAGRRDYISDRYDQKVEKQRNEESTQPKYGVDYVLKWGVYDQSFNLFVDSEVDEIIIPIIKDTSRSKSYRKYEKYYVLKKKRYFGIISSDGRWIANIELSKAQAIAMLNFISKEYQGEIFLS